MERATEVKKDEGEGRKGEGEEEEEDKKEEEKEKRRGKKKRYWVHDRCVVWLWIGSFSSIP